MGYTVELTAVGGFRGPLVWQFGSLQLFPAQLDIDCQRLGVKSA